MSLYLSVVYRNSEQWNLPTQICSDLHKCPSSLKREAVGSTKELVNCYQTTSHHIQQRAVFFFFSASETVYLNISPLKNAVNLFISATCKMILTFRYLVLYDSSLFAERKYSLLWRTYELFKNCAGAHLSIRANEYRKKYVEIWRRSEFSGCSKIFYITK